MTRPTSPPGPDPAAVARDGAALVLTREALRWAAPVAAVLVVGAFLVRGTTGGVTALVTAAALLAIQAASGWLVGTAGRLGPQALQAATLFGVLGRLGLYAVLLVLLADVTAIDRPVLAVVVVTLTLVVLAAEARMALRYAKYWWQPRDDAGPAPAPALATASAAPTSTSASAPSGADTKDRP